MDEEVKNIIHKFRKQIEKDMGIPCEKIGKWDITEEEKNKFEEECREIIKIIKEGLKHDK